MTLTPAGRLVVTLLALSALLAVVGVASRVASGQWDPQAVLVVGISAPLVGLLALMSWRWRA